MAFFLISVRKMSWENSHCNEENTVKKIQNFDPVDCFSFLAFRASYPTVKKEYGGKV